MIPQRFLIVFFSLIVFMARAQSNAVFAVDGLMLHSDKHISGNTSCVTSFIDPGQNFGLVFERLFGNHFICAGEFDHSKEAVHFSEYNNAVPHIEFPLVMYAGPAWYSLSAMGGYYHEFKSMPLTAFALGGFGIDYQDNFQVNRQFYFDGLEEVLDQNGAHMDYVHADINGLITSLHRIVPEVAMQAGVEYAYKRFKLRMSTEFLDKLLYCYHLTWKTSHSDNYYGYDVTCEGNLRAKSSQVLLKAGIGYSF